MYEQTEIDPVITWEEFLGYLDHYERKKIKSRDEVI